MFGSLAITAISGVVSFIVGLEQLKNASGNILEGAKNYIKKNIIENKDSILKFISNIPIVGDSVKKLLSFLGFETIGVLYLISSIFFASSTWSIYLFTGVTLITLTKSAEILEYVKLLSCQVIEQDYLVNRRERPPREISEILATSEKLTLEEYYKDFDKRVTTVTNRSSNIVYSVMSPLASLNVLITDFITKNYTIIAVVIIIIVIIIVIKIVR